jgi:ADP-ribosyl-[dinitrogen reductase] hydrolase
VLEVLFLNLPTASKLSENEMSQRARGLMLGLAVGDAVGLPAEGLRPSRVRALFPPPWRHRFLGHYGLCSDDTEHAWFVLQSLLAHEHDSQAFARRLGWCLRGWFIGLPAGIGWATLRACIKLWLGFPPQYSGVFSGGNGAAMRSAPIGLRFAFDAAQRDAYVCAATRLTHTDPKALVGAKAVADLVAWSIRTPLYSRPAITDFVAVLRHAGQDDSVWQAHIDDLARALNADASVAQYAAGVGLAQGISGYVYHTVPVAAYAWFVHWGDFSATLSAVWNCGGDTDTCGAIAGALAGTVCGHSGIPEAWKAGLIEWPRSRTLLERGADTLAARVHAPDTDPPPRPLKYFWPALPLRNVLFLLIVLGHGVRRIIPPY